MTIDLTFSSDLNYWVGCLVGLAIGDQLGSTIEGKAPGTFQPIIDMVDGSFWTDDTSQALCLADSLISVGRLDAIHQLDRYARWLFGGYLSSQESAYGVGPTARQAITNFRDSGQPQPVANATSNGALMRLAPVPMFYAKDLELAVQMSADSAATTHGSSVCIDACRLYSSLILKALGKASKTEILKYHARLWHNRSLDPKVEQVARGSYQRKKPPEIRGTIHIVEVMEAALWSFNQTSSFSEGILLAVNLGDDADTTGAIFGQLTGAYYGYNEIPDHWKPHLIDRALIEYLALKLFEVRP